MPINLLAPQALLDIEQTLDVIAAAQSPLTGAFEFIGEIVYTQSGGDFEASNGGPPDGNPQGTRTTFAAVQREQIQLPAAIHGLLLEMFVVAPSDGVAYTPNAGVNFAIVDFDPLCTLTAGNGGNYATTEKPAMYSMFQLTNGMFNGISWTTTATMATMNIGDPQPVYAVLGQGIDPSATLLGRQRYAPAVQPFTSGGDDYGARLMFDQRSVTLTQVPVPSGHSIGIFIQWTTGNDLTTHTTFTFHIRCFAIF